MSFRASLIDDILSYVQKKGVMPMVRMSLQFPAEDPCHLAKGHFSMIDEHGHVQSLDGQFVL